MWEHVRDRKRREEEKPKGRKRTLKGETDITDCMSCYNYVKQQAARLIILHSRGDITVASETESISDRGSDGVEAREKRQEKMSHTQIIGGERKRSRNVDSDRHKERDSQYSRLYRSAGSKERRQSKGNTVKE